MASDPFGGGSGGGGGGKDPFGGGGGSSSGGGSTKKKSSSRRDPKKELIRNLGKALASPGNPLSQQTITKSVQGLKPHEVRQVGTDLGLPAANLHRLVQMSRQAHSREEQQGYVSPGLVTAMDVLDRPAQGTKGELVETFSGTVPNPIAGAKGAWRGLSGQEKYRGSEVAGVVGLGKTKKEAQKWAKGLPWYAGVPLDIAVDTATDPTNYVTFGAGGLADDAARTAAKITVGQAVKDAALSGPARDVYQNILAKGFKGLTEAQKATLKSTFKGGKVPRELVRKINRAQGGVRIAGHQVPGTRGLLSNVGPKSHGLGSSVEKFVRPDAEVKQLARSGEIARNVPADVTNVQAQVHGSEFFAGLASKRAERGAEEALGRGLTDAEFGSRRAVKAGRKALEDDPTILDRVLRTLDVGGGAAARTALPKGERDLAEFLSTLRGEDQAALEGVGRLRSDAEQIAAHRQMDLFGDNIDLQDPTLEDQYVFHMREPTNTGRRGAGSKTPAFLQPRTNREPIAGVPGYVQDPVTLMAKHQAGTIRETSQINAWRELEDTSPSGMSLAIRGDDVKPGSAISAKLDSFKAANPDWADNYVQLSSPTLEGSGRLRQPVLIRKEIAPFYEKFAKATGGKTFVDSVKYLSALWAGYAIATPGFIARNVLQGNMMLAWMADGLNPKVWAEQLGTMRRMSKGIGRLGDPYAFLNDSEKELIRGALSNNAIESNFVDSLRDQAHRSADALGQGRGAAFWHAAKTKRYSPLSTEFAPVGAVKHANQWAEGWSRLGIYATKIKQGYAPPEAAAIARRYLLDYKNLSPANDALRTINPFLTWTYKVTPLILSEAVHDPRKIRIPQTILNAIGNEGSEKPGIQSEWMAEAGGQRIPGTHQTFIPSTPLETANQSLQPLLTMLQTARGQRSQSGGLSKAALEAINILGGGGPIGGTAKSVIEAGTGTQLFTGRKMQPGSRIPNPIPGIGGTLPWELSNAINNLIPTASKLSSVAPKTEYDREARKRRLISQFGGTTVFPNDKAAANSELWRRVDELVTWLAEAKARGKKIKTKTPGGGSKSSSGDPF